MNTLRQLLRQKRKAISAIDQARFGRILLSKVQQVARFKNGQKIALYLPNDGEINPKTIQNFLKNKGFSVYLPILTGKHLRFGKIGKHFRKNRFGIDEPIANHSLGAHQLNIILIPLVGFDACKNRIGMGYGFYDRTLAFKTRQRVYKPQKLYGLAFDCQKVEKLTPQAWDIPLDAIITPNQVY